MKSLCHTREEFDTGTKGGRRRWFLPVAAMTLLLLALAETAASPVAGATAEVPTVPPLWTAGGLSAGNDSAGQAARIAVDASGNIAIVSGPAFARSLAVTSYTPSGALRWQRTVSPSVGTFIGDWVAAAPNGDFIAVGRNTDSHGDPIAITLVRYASNGTLQWRIDLARTRPYVARMLVDAGGNAYLAFSSIGDGQDIQLHKYSAGGSLLWARGISTGYFANDIATSLALSPDGTEVVLTGDIAGGAAWITALYDTSTGSRKWLVNAAEGTAALDVVVDATRVYVAGQGSVGTYGFLTVVAYDRATGTRLWRTDANPPTCCAYGSRIALASDGSLVVAGSTSSGGYIDWWIVSMDTNGVVKWQARRDRALSGDEVPAAVFVLADGTIVVSGTGGPVIRDILGNQFMQGVTAGFSPNGTPLWEGITKLGAVWGGALPNGDVCATGGYDALITCWRLSGVASNQAPTAVMTAVPSSGPAPLTVTFNGSGSTDPDGTVTSWAWSFGDGTSGTGAVTTHTYTTPGMTYTASLTVRDNGGAASTTTATIVVDAPPPPAAPSGLTGTIPGTVVMLAWQDNSLNETAFYIERCEGTGCANFASLGTQWANVPSYNDYSAALGRSYSYRVRAYNAGGYSTYSNIASVVTPQPPAAPGNLTATALTRSSIGLKWTNATVGQWVKIERCRGSGCTNFVQVATVAGTATTFTDSGLAQGTTYTYRVRVTTAQGDSPYSNTASARTKR